MSTTTISEKVHPGQQAVLESEAKYRILACGRRWGKTKTCARAARDDALTHSDDFLIWWVSPTYLQSDIGFRELLKETPDELIVDINRTKRRIEFVTGVRVEFKTAEKPDNLRGEGVDLLIIDEAAQVGKYAWENALSPTLADNPDSKLIAISTPRGRNWFHPLFLRGQDPDEPDYQSWNRPSTENPWIDHEFIEEQKRTMPDRVFEQEYLAEFKDDSGGVFPGVRERNVEDYDWREYDGRDPYSMGVDFARHQDWTVITILDNRGKLCYWERLRDEGWPRIQNAVEQAWEIYQGPVRVDATRDNKIVSDLEAAGLPVEPVKFSPQVKRDLIESLATRLENGEITLPDIPQVVNELEIFEYDTTPAGNVRYQAPEGFHDDCVDSLALAASGSGGWNVGVAFG
jgi:hypothetical protein